MFATLTLVAGLALFAPIDDAAENHLRQQEAVAELGLASLKVDDLDSVMSKAVQNRQPSSRHRTQQVLELLPDSKSLLPRAGVGWREGLVGHAAVGAGLDYEGPLHLVVTDEIMPLMGGRALAERITSVRQGVKVLFLSGYSDNAVIRPGVREAEVAFLQKPFTTMGFAQKVRDVLDEH